MSSAQPSKLNSTIDSAIGVVKENVGWAIGNESLQANGKELRVKADAEYKAAQAAGYVEGTKDNIKGNVKETVGSAIGNEQMQYEGKAERLKGQAQKEINS